jgi:hypothetical protein
MNKSMMLVASTAFIAASAAMGQDIPDPNPVPNADGTVTYYTGWNMQFTPSQALALCGAGDDIVIVEGSYVESLVINVADVTVRPETVAGEDNSNDNGTGAGVAFIEPNSWAPIILVNPTQGPAASNASAVSVTADNVTVGRPNLITELANGNITVTTVPVAPAYDTSITPPGELQREWVATATLTPICSTDADGDPNWSGDDTLDGAGAVVSTANARSYLQRGLDNGTDMDWAPLTGLPVPNVNGVAPAIAFQIQSRSMDKSAIIAGNCAANFNYINITTDSGFGGGVQCLGADNTSVFNSCTISGTFSTSQDSAGNPVRGIYVGGGAPMFNDCEIAGNGGGINGVVRLAAGRATFNGCTIDNNSSPISNGIVTMATNGFFNGCTFSNNTARLGTIYLDSTSLGGTDYVTLSGCFFDSNVTGDGQWGGVAFCTDAVSGRSPMIVLDRCELRNAQTAGTTQGANAFQHDIVSNYFPRYRVGSDSTVGDIDPGITGAGVANAEGEDDGDAPSGNPADVNGDGVVNGADLAAVLGSWG